MTKYEFVKAVGWTLFITVLSVIVILVCCSMCAWYITRVKNPLKRRQAMIAVSCKLIRVFYVVLTKGLDYDRMKMKTDIHRDSDLIAV